MIPSTFRRDIPSLTKKMVKVFSFQEAILFGYLKLAYISSESAWNL